MNILLDLLLEPMRYEFFRNALLAALMVGVLSGVMGVYIVLRGLSYIGHGLSHAAFGGAVLGLTYCGSTFTSRRPRAHSSPH